MVIDEEAHPKIRKSRSKWKCGLDWVGGEFNPDSFFAEDVNRRLSTIQHWWAKTEAG
jgi:hypothetical protein